MHEQLEAVVAGRTGESPDKVRVSERPALAHQSNRLYDVYCNDVHLIAKEYLRTDELRLAPAREFNALVRLEPYDIAPRPVYYDSEVAPIVIYEYMTGSMWDRACPSPKELAQLAETWLTMHEVSTAGLWLSRGYDRPLLEKIGDIGSGLRRYATWAEKRHLDAFPATGLFPQLIEEIRHMAVDLDALAPTLYFCRADPRFANVIRRPDDRLGLVDWEDSGLRDPARDIADMMTHPNQEDLLGVEDWPAFLDRYLAERPEQDDTLAERIHLYLGIFPVWWLAILLGQGIEQARRDAVQKWTINGMPANQRLRRYLARALSWPKPFDLLTLDSVADVDFFPDTGH